MQFRHLSKLFRSLRPFGRPVPPAAPEKSRPIARIEHLENRQLLAAGWGAIPHLIEQDTAAQHYKKTTGRGQTVAIIDTGVDYTHRSLGGRWGRKVIGGYDFVDRDTDPMDEDGHGTAVAGVIAANAFTYQGLRHRGIANGAKIVALRVDDGRNFVPNGRIEEALRWIIRHRDRYGITSVNMSFGEGTYYRKTSLKPYGDELATLRKMGVFLAAASGNEGISKQGVNYPGADFNVVSVGSVSSGDIISRFTTRGPDLDLLAPGENVPTVLSDPRKGTHGYASASGTSFATPFVAGAAALLKQANRKLNPTQMLRIFKAASVPNRDGDRENPATNLTFPRINIDDSIRLALDAKAGKVEFKKHRIVRVEQVEQKKRKGNSRVRRSELPAAADSAAVFNTEKLVGFFEERREGVAGVCG